MNLKVTSLCTAADATALIHRYWAIDEHGQFRERVHDLLPFRSLTKAAQITQFVREQSRVHDLNQPCPRCGEPVEITSRSMARSFPRRSVRPCGSCTAHIDASLRDARHKAETQLAERLQAYMQTRDLTPVDFTRVSDDTALLLLALHMALNEQLPAGAFGSGSCSAMVAEQPGLFIRRLFQAGVLIEEPAHAQRGTYFLKNGQLRVKDAQRVYGLSPGLSNEQFNRLLASYRARAYSDAPRVYDLWLDYAAGECMVFFNLQCTVYGHSLYDEEIADIRSVLRGALEHYCVAQLWSVAWRVVRDAASQASRPYYDRAKAAASIPGALRRLLLRGQRETLEFKHWARPNTLPAGTLGQLFSQLFQVTENTPGPMVWSQLAQRSERWSALAEPASWRAARRLMMRALEADMPYATLRQLHELLGRGAGLEGAIDDVLARLPAPAV